MMSEFSLHVYCAFSGMSMLLPFGNSKNYERASELAIRLLGENGRVVSPPDQETFYIETVEQLDALFDLQRQLKIADLVELQRASTS